MICKPPHVTRRHQIAVGFGACCCEQQRPLLLCSPARAPGLLAGGVEHLARECLQRYAGCGAATPTASALFPPARALCALLFAPCFQPSPWPHVAAGGRGGCVWRGADPALLQNVAFALLVMETPPKRVWVPPKICFGQRSERVGLLGWLARLDGFLPALTILFLLPPQRYPGLGWDRVNFII